MEMKLTETDMHIAITEYVQRKGYTLQESKPNNTRITFRMERTVFDGPIFSTIVEVK